MWLRAIALIAVAAAMLGACSSGSSGRAQTDPRIHASADASNNTAPPSNGAACELLDVPAADAYFKTTTKSQYDGTGTCVRRAGDGRLSIAVWNGQSRTYYDKYRATRGDAQALTGVGDAADYSPASNAVQFLKGNQVVTVALAGPGAVSASAKAFLVAQAKYAAKHV